MTAALQAQDRRARCSPRNDGGAAAHGTTGALQATE
jgi:hypothetical protein